VIERQQFGRTGHASSRVIFGAAALSSIDQETADTLLPLLDRFGINHLDTAASYGEAELRLAPWLATRRDDFFLATKTGERTGDGARRELERSLGLLGVDSVDLIQLHNLVEPDEWETAHGPGGAVAALSRARDEGLVKAIGVTGHGLRIPRMHLAGLERFDFDSVLFPYNFKLRQIEEYRRDTDELIEFCRGHQVAMQTIKSIARRRWPEPRPPERRSWYQPLEDLAALSRAIHHVLAQPGLFVNSSSDYRLLHDVLRAADRDLEPPTIAELEGDAELLEMAPLFDGGELERI